MSKRNKIIYWVATIWLSIGMVSTSVVQLLQLEDEVQRMSEMGYPKYVMTLVGIWKLVGVIAILIPKFQIQKEWAYAGFFFLMTGAIFSHIAIGDELIEFFGPTLLLILTIISWYFRPDDRKIELKK